eukprot:160165-Chlamydomonas_euryale.AAC.3
MHARIFVRAVRAVRAQTPCWLSATSPVRPLVPRACRSALTPRSSSTRSTSWACRTATCWRRWRWSKAATTMTVSTTTKTTAWGAASTSRTRTASTRCPMGTGTRCCQSRPVATSHVTVGTRGVSCGAHGWAGDPAAGKAPSKTCGCTVRCLRAACETEGLCAGRL